MSYVQSIKHVFFDGDGNILENGKIYIGQPNVDPRIPANQKTVTFTDNGGNTVTAAQPLRTIHGRISYNGRPIAAAVTGEHSMLVLNSSDVQIDYTPSIVQADAGGAVDLSETIRVGLVLDDVKAFDVSVGDVVRSVGRAIATDDLGADWLVISATGGAGDDIDLIDFDNGLQGQRDKSKLYQDSVLPYVADQTFNPDAPTEVWSGSSTSVSVAALSSNGPGFYIVEADSGTQFLFASAYGLSSITNNLYGSSYSTISTGPSPFTVTSAYLYISYQGANKFIRVYEYQYDINNAGTVLTNRTETPLTITKIFKV